MFKDEHPKSIFEIGCANGGLLHDLYSYYWNEITWSEIQVGGNEISNCIHQCHQQFPHQKFNFYKETVIESWSTPSKSYDIVFSVGVLMYLCDPLSALREMFRVAKDKVILAEYHDEEQDIYGQIMAGSIDEKGRMHTGIARNYEELLKLIDVPMEVSTSMFEGKTIIKCKIK